MKSPYRYMKDTLQNLVTGLGTAADRGMLTTYQFAPMDPGQMEMAFRSDWLARKIITIPPQDMTREWRTWEASNDEIEKLEAEEVRLGIVQKVYRAQMLARLYGGAALILGLPGAPSSPLNPELVTEGGLRYVHAVSRHHISAGQVVDDLEDPYFGQPGHYEVQGRSGPVRVHPSRVMRFLGPELPDWRQGDGWGDSVLQVVDDAVKAAQTTFATIPGLVSDAKVDVIRIPDFMSQVSTAEYRERLQTRFNLANIMKSTVHSLVLDKEEEWERIQTEFAGLPEVVKLMFLVASGAADIPVTRLLGQSPVGLNSTGESDIRNYYDRLASEQALQLQPTIAPLDECLIRSALGGRPDEIHYTWEPLWQMSEAERSKIDKERADTTAVYHNTGLLPSEALARGAINQLIESGVYPGLEDALEEFPLEAHEAEMEEAAAAEEALAAEEAKLRLTQPAPAPAPGSTRPTARTVAADATPRTLYVRRNVLNGAEVRKWAKAQGLQTAVPAADMHVTIAFSRTPVDWMKMGNADDWGGGNHTEGTMSIPAGGPRVVERLGQATVLMFSSTQLQWRHEAIRRHGASWDFPDYQPHIPLTWDLPPSLDPSKIEPYRGPIMLGPEIFEELDTNWREGVTEDAAAPDEDAL